MKFRKFTRYIVVAVLLLVSFAVQAQHHPRFDTIRERLANRTFPSTFDAWGGLGWVNTVGPYVDGLRDGQIIALADLQWTNMWGYVRWWPQPDGTLRLDDNASFERAEAVQRGIMFQNPNIIMLQATPMRLVHRNFFPPDSPYWVRDENGNNRINGAYYMDFTHPDVQDIIVNHAINAAESGIYDGIFFDFWHEGRAVLPYSNQQAEYEARINIFTRIREATHPDFLIIGNTNDRIENAETTAHLLNGAFIETFADDGIGYTYQRVRRMEEALQWFEANMREPVVNCLEGSTPLSGVEAANPEVQHWMRLFTTMSLVHSDGFILYENAAEGEHHHIWYDFWDADLGRPISPKSERIEGIGLRGCFIREFDNGWVVYNRDVSPVNVILPDVAVGVTTGKYDFIHEVPNLDGEIFLRSHPTNVHPGSKLTTLWGKIKSQ